MQGLLQTYTSETPQNAPLRGSSNAGGGEAMTEQNAGSALGSMMHFFREYGSREDASYFNTRGIDHQHKPPKWMEHKDVAVDGTPLTPEEKAAKGYWRSVYEKELAIGEAIAETKKQQRAEQLHSLWGTINNAMRKFGMAEPLSVDRAKAKAVQAMSTREAEQELVATMTSSQTSPRGRGTPSAAWEALMVSLDTQRPIARVAMEYRPTVDFYGIDPFLDSTLSFVWLCARIGMFIGLAQGTAKTMQVVNVDAQYLRASGVGILSLLNVTVFAGVIKWGGNLALFGSAFCIGDRLATYSKKWLYPDHDAKRRSPLNYVCGMSMAFATVGTLPWWLLNDVRFGVRLGVSCSFIGACLGGFVGLALDRMVALNLSKLDASNRDLRRFEALMKRETIWMENENKKIQDNTKTMLF